MHVKRLRCGIVIESRRPIDIALADMQHARRAGKSLEVLASPSPESQRKRELLRAHLEENRLIGHFAWANKSDKAQ